MLARNRERWHNDPILSVLLEVLYLYRGLVRKTILKNIALMTRALLILFSGARSGNGMLTKAAIGRCLPLESPAKARQTRLSRFLTNPRFTPESMIPLFVALAVGTTFKERIPMIIDQTTIMGIPTLLVGLIYEGRVLPVAFTSFMYDTIEKSQNAIEYALMLAVASCFPPDKRPVLVMDRGYARVSLLPKLEQAGIPFLLRVPKNVSIFIGNKKTSPGRLPAPRGCCNRYRVLYHGSARYPVDLIVYHGIHHEEPWYLIVPFKCSLSKYEIVELYTRRMCIEQGFRDWKTHLGIRGIRFTCQEPAPRMTRLLLALTLGYLIVLVIGSSPEAQRLRPYLEVPRLRPRHGTTRTLSSLSIGLMRLSLETLRETAKKEIIETLKTLKRGMGIIYLFAP